MENDDRPVIVAELGDGTVAAWFLGDRIDEAVDLLEKKFGPPDSMQC